uniref:Reverse transcriptase domain-containing protein n=1 Tax=Arion vulgaris TaxID=1028688 RepID=A0A0B7BQI3_9EUPU
MLINLSLVARIKLLKIINHSWQKDIVSQIWREAITLLIPKKGKCRTKSSGYRPISLTSCVAKTMERVINNRMK